MVTSALNPSVDTWTQSVGATAMECRLTEWTAERTGFVAGDGVFTSGGTMSNVHALLLARGEALARGHALEDLRILTSGNSHVSTANAARLLGLRHDAVMSLPLVDNRLDPRAVAGTLEGVWRDRVKGQ